jgi:hypothetical protein
VYAPRIKAYTYGDDMSQQDVKLMAYYAPLHLCPQVTMCILGWAFVLLLMVHGVIQEYLAYFTKSLITDSPFMQNLLLNKVCQVL